MSLDSYTSIEISSLELFKKGKVRNVYRLPGGLLFVATDRISAFDSVLPNGIPDKGRVLSELSVFWFEETSGIVPNHIITDDVTKMPLPEDCDLDLLRDRLFLQQINIRLDEDLSCSHCQPVSFFVSHFLVSVNIFPFWLYWQLKKDRL